MHHLFLHIKTIPCQRPGLLAELRANVAAPAKLSNADSIKKWQEENGDAAALEAFVKTAYDGTLGEIVAIAWAYDGNPVRCMSRSLGEAEDILLQNFFDAVVEEGPFCNALRIVGHNILGFDLRFLYQRSVILSIRPSFDLEHDTRYNNSRVYDLMVAWAGFNKFVSLPELARGIGFSAENGLCAAEVWDCMQTDRVDTVTDLCIHNVLLLRQVFHAMTFSEFYVEADHVEG